jgi:hypothetical protein
MIRIGARSTLVGAGVLGALARAAVAEAFPAGSG